MPLHSFNRYAVKQYFNNKKMKKLALICMALVSTCLLQAQTWESVGFLGGFVRTSDEFQNKLVIAGLGVQMFDGTAWTELTGYQNPGKYCARNINDVLYMGAANFSTNGEHIIHTYDGTTVTEKQGHRQFSYNGNKKIMDFVKANSGKIYTCDRINFFEWADSSQRWEMMNVPVATGFLNINYIFEHDGKFAFSSSNEVYFYDGITWDSLGLSNQEIVPGKMIGSVTSFCKKGSATYFTGTFTLITSPTTGTSGNILKVEGSNKTIYKASFGQDTTAMGMATLRCIFVDGNDDIYVTGKKNPMTNDVHFMKYNGSQWSDLGLLVEAGKGLYPNIPGSEIADYNHLFKYNNNLYLGGRFVTIGGDSIAGLAKFKGTTTGVKETTAIDFSVHPNPSLGHIIINTNQQGNITLFAINGQAVLQSTCAFGQNTLLLNHLNKGIYYYHFVAKNGESKTGKLVIN